MTEQQVILTMNIDVERRRIRVNKNVIDALGNPPYIQFLINTEKCKFAIRSVEKELSNSQTMRINPRGETKSKRYEFSSLTLINKLLNAMGVKDATGSYQLMGEAIPNENIILFSFDNIRKIK